MHIIPVKTKNEIKAFLELPFQIYQNDKNWVPPLRKEVGKVFNREGNPFLEHAKIERFLCMKNSRAMGRIAGIIDNNYNLFHNEKTAFFGFYESIDDCRVSSMLFDSVSAWAKEEGMERLRGPLNPSMNAECAFLLEGFNRPPVLMMPYNPPYYLELAENYGFRKTKDLYAFYKDSSKGIPERFERVVKVIRKRTGVTVRHLNMKKLTDEVNIIKQIYNSSWEKNWGFVPMTEAEMDMMVKLLKPLVVPDLVLFAELEGKPVGVSISVPDYNQVLKHLNGSLGLLGMAKFIYYRHKVTGLRALVFGVLEEYRKAGLHAVLYYETEKAARRLGYKWCELSWNLEDNDEINKFDASLGGEVYKKYRIYEKDL
ncbi:MAG: hypothetical protein J7K40_11175 [candidate division Zixibacteria bacterium]|nr:hypothetical protein [candidate division Zixibacteria bacterium]